MTIKFFNRKQVIFTSLGIIVALSFIIASPLTSFAQVQFTQPENNLTFNFNWNGSVQSMPLIYEALLPKVKVSLNDATNNALQQVAPNGHAVESSLQTERGFLIYIVSILDNNYNLHRVIVDAGTGKVLSDFPRAPVTILQNPTQITDQKLTGFPGNMTGDSFNIP